MKISHSLQSGLPVIHLSGRLDASHVPEFKKYAYDIVAKESNNFVIDFNELIFIDRSGLGSLVAILRNVSKTNGNVYLADLRPEVQSLFELTRLHRVFDIFTSVDDAVQAFKKR